MGGPRKIGSDICLARQLSALFESEAIMANHLIKVFWGSHPDGMTNY